MISPLAASWDGRSQDRDGDLTCRRLITLPLVTGAPPGQRLRRNEPRDVLPLFLAESALLVWFDHAGANADQVRVPHASEGIQGGESRNRPPHASLPRQQRDSRRGTVR